MVGRARSRRLARRTLPLTSTAAFEARQLVRENLTSWQLRDHVHTIELVATELVSNALRHAGPREDVEFELSADRNRIRVSVVDGSALRPAARQVEAEETSGRGMYIVEQLVDRWGAEDLPGGGKQVWIEVDVSR